MIARFVFKSIPALFTAGVLVIVLQSIDTLPSVDGLMQTAARLWETLTTAPQVTTDDKAEVNVVSTEALVTAMQGLNRWETQGATVTGCATVDNNETNHFYSYFVGETLALCGTGTVIAGVDMSLFTDTLSIKNDGRTVDVRVPDAQVFSLTVDQSQMRRESGQRGWFAPDKSAMLNQTAQIKVQEAMLQEACAQALTQRAADEFTMVVTKLLKAVNPQITTVNVFVNAGDCKSIAPMPTK
jgi:hypothetical protein